MVNLHTVRANGLEFCYLEQGTGPLVLLLHGFPDTPHTWDRVMPALAAAGYRAVAPFMRGYHPTSVPGDAAFDSDTLGRDALALIAALENGHPAIAPEEPQAKDRKARAILVGHDWGASAAYSAAALGPASVRLLITLAIPHPRAIKLTPKLLWNSRHFVSLRRANAAKWVRRDDFAHVDVLVKRWAPAWDVPADATLHVKAAFSSPGSLEAALGYYRAGGILRMPASHKLPITVPAIAFAGTHDVISPRAYEKARHCFTGPYEVIQVPGGHFMHREHPEEFANELVRAVRDHDRVR